MKKTQEKILENAVVLFAQEGFENTSMRVIAMHVGIKPSVLYHYFENKEELLKAAFGYATRKLGVERSLQRKTKTPREKIKQSISFQFDHALYISAILKLYMAYRNTFPKLKNGYIPELAYAHITNAIEEGVSLGEFVSKEPASDAKVITHAINGYILEYFPNIPNGKERIQIIESIYSFIIRALTYGKN